MSVLACQDLAFSYDGKDVLKGVNFTLKQGEKWKDNSYEGTFAP